MYPYRGVKKKDHIYEVSLQGGQEERSYIKVSLQGGQEEGSYIRGIPAGGSGQIKSNHLGLSQRVHDGGGGVDCLNGPSA